MLLDTTHRQSSNRGGCTCWFLPLIKFAGMSAVVRPTGTARGGNNNSICAAPAAAAAHHCFTITPPLGSLGATDTAHKLHATLLLLPSIKRSITSREGSVFNLAASLPTSFLSLLHSPAATRARMLLLRPEIPRQTATSARACASRRRRRLRRRCSGGMEEILSRRLANLRQGTL